MLPSAACRGRSRQLAPLLLQHASRSLASQAQSQQQQQGQQQFGSGAKPAAAAFVLAAAAAAAAASSAPNEQQQQQPLLLRLFCTTAAADAASGAEAARPELARSRAGDPGQDAAALARAEAAMRANAGALRAARLVEWLRRSGADVGAVELAPSLALLAAGKEGGKRAGGGGGTATNDGNAENAKTAEDVDAPGYGILAGRGLRGRMRAAWLGRRLGAALVPAGGTVVAARVPLRLAVTPDSVARDPALGPHVRELASLGLVDGRTAVVLALCVHRALGDASELAPWVDALPRAFEGSPLWWATSGAAAGGGRRQGQAGDDNQGGADLSPRLQELRGTSLAAAASAHHRRLSAQWQRLRPAAEAMVKDAAALAAAAAAAGGPAGGGGGGSYGGGGAPSPPRAPTFDDYRWAYAIYWSRAHSLPVPVSEDEEEEQQQQEQAGQGAAADVRPAAAKQRRRSVRIVEGLVPGLDFCNHSLDPNAWWEVVPAGERAEAAAAAAAGVAKSKGESGDPQEERDSADADADGGSVLLLAHRARLPRTGGELFISYGDKGNEELLLLHGFAAERNPHDAAMLPCPLPRGGPGGVGGAGGGGAGGGGGTGGGDDEGGWDDVLRARLELLHGMGLAPQLFLTAVHLRELELDQRRLGWDLPEDPLSSSGAAGGGSAGAASSSSSPSPSSSPPSDPATWRLSSARVRALPPGGRETLEAFVVPPEEVAERLRLLDEEGAAGAARASVAAVAAAADPSAPPTARVEALGWAMATLTTFVRLLELRVLALEAEDEGTGPLERDLALLQGRGADEAGGVADDGAPPPPPPAPLEGWRRACVLYRAGQKRMVRGYLRAARAELQATLAELREAIEAEEKQLEREEEGARAAAAAAAAMASASSAARAVGDA